MGIKTEPTFLSNMEVIDATEIPQSTSGTYYKYEKLYVELQNLNSDKALRIPGVDAKQKTGIYSAANSYSKRTGRVIQCRSMTEKDSSNPEERTYVVFLKEKAK